MLNVFDMINIQGRELNYTTCTFNFGFHLDTDEMISFTWFDGVIFFKLGLLVDTTKLYILIPV